MKLNFIQNINLFFWAFLGNAKLKEYNKNIEKGMNQVMAYKQAVAFAPIKINYREIKAGHLVLDDDIPTKVVSCNCKYCEVLDDDNQPVKRQWKDIHPIPMKMNWLVHYGFTCKATIWMIEGTEFYVTYFDETGWHFVVFIFYFNSLWCRLLKNDMRQCRWCHSFIYGPPIII